MNRFDGDPRCLAWPPADCPPTGDRGDDPVPGFRARPNAILHQALDRGLGTHATTLARVTGLHVDTVRNMLHGHPVSSATVDAVCQALDCSVETIFESVDTGEPAASLRVAR